MRIRITGSAFLWVFVLAGLGSLPLRAVEIVKVLDRKFPTGKYCPLESRAIPAGVNLSFTAPASTVRVTFSADNEKSGQWNELHLDNISVVLKSVFDAHQTTAGTPGFTDCFAGAGFGNAPAYRFDDASTPEILLDLFGGTTTDGWSGTNVSRDTTAGRIAPTDPVTGTGLTGGALWVGNVAGVYVASASKTVTGLVAGQQYVVFAWAFEQADLPVTIKIYVPCADLDGDGYVVCGACDPQAGQTCGECNDTRAHCGTSCTDADGDTWCAGMDCNDSVASCTGDCVTDTDTDGTADCRDTCADADHDGYGSAGAAGNTCLGADCSDSLPFCNTSCTDADGDTHCLPGDCQDTNSGVANQLPEVNDCSDQQCPGDIGYGVIDETSGVSGFLTAGNKNLYSWPAQSGATSYLVARATNPTFTTGCMSFAAAGTSFANASTPPAGTAYFYLNRPVATCKGSWGQRSGGVERAVICGVESNCSNGADDDGDASTDCADADCNDTAACRVQTFAFTDTTADNIATNALELFFQTATASAGDYIFFQIVESPTRTIAWCSLNAAYYKTQYLALAPTLGSATSGSWNKWRKSPSTANVWTGPDTAGHLNTYGDNCFGDRSWCAEQWSPEPRTSIFPDRTNDCEAYDLTTGACGASVGGTWQLTLKIAATRLLACGF